jgi:ribosomal protein S19E (S16A)
MPLGKCLKEISHREYLTWMAHFDNKWENPSRNEWYLISIATEIRRVLSKDPNKIKLDHLKLGFGDLKESKITSEQKAKESKANWLGHFGTNIKRVFKSKQDGK